MPEQIRVAVIGTGFGARCQMPAFAAHPETKLVAVASHSLERARIAAQTHGVPFYSDDYRNVVTREGRGPRQHRRLPPHPAPAPITLAAFKAGKHVLCEKPMALNEREALRMVNAARKARRVGLIDHEISLLARARAPARPGQRWLARRRPAHHVDRDAVVDGGRRGLSLRLAIANQVWRRRAGCARFTCDRILPRHRRARSATSMRRSRRRVEAPAARRRRHVADVDADDNASVRLVHASGAISSIEICATAAASVSTIVVSGSKGVLRIDGDQPLRRTGRTRRRAGDRACTHAEEVSDRFAMFASAPGILRVRRRSRVAAIRNESSTAPTFADGLRVQRALDGARRSSRSGQVRADRAAQRKGRMKRIDPRCVPRSQQRARRHPRER